MTAVDRFASATWQGGNVAGSPARLTAATSTAIVALAAFLTIAFAPTAQALPSFARQTGQPCGSCHTDYPGLTPYGRLFKIGGYVYGGGHYRTALFPDWNDSKQEKKKPWVPPISMMAMIEPYVHTQVPGDNTPFSPNDNAVLDQFSLFYGGAITDHIGMFQQLTYDGVGLAWGWDNTDLRYANTAHLGRFNVTYGITANNNPTVQDPWNTMPAWVFPYISPAFGAPGFAAAPIIDGGFAQAAVSVGGYAYINDLVYLEGSVYRTLNPSILTDLGADPTAQGQFDAAPYWRAAIEPHWGRNWLEFGTFGMAADVHPYSAGTGSGATYFSQTVNYTDIGLDTQYQYQGDNYWLTLRGTWIHEDIRTPNGLIGVVASNPSNTLSDARAYASLAYGNDNRVVLTGQYFIDWGTADDTIYGGSPDTKGWVAEIAYIPFMESHAPGWPWFNARVGLQYTWYNEFNGTSAGASDNNTLMLYVWLAM